VRCRPAQLQWRIDARSRPSVAVPRASPEELFAVAVEADKLHFVAVTGRSQAAALGEFLKVVRFETVKRGSVSVAVVSSTPVFLRSVCCGINGHSLSVEVSLAQLLFVHCLLSLLTLA
jgi:hypothetical protein